MGLELNKGKNKILVIGDVHQSEHWKRFDFSKYSKVIFLGDYFDDFNSDWSKLNPINNLEEILKLQRKDPDKIIVLLGNHDWQYIADEIYSGKQFNKEIDIKEFLKKHIREFRVVYQIGDYLFSHAGVSSQWMEDWKLKNFDTVNSLLYNEIYTALGFYPWDFSGYGESKHQGPLWIRPQALDKVPYKNFNQIVGHTHTKGPNGVAKFLMNNNKDLIVVDNIAHTAYYELEI